MTQITVKNAAGSDIAVARVVDTGSTTDANSLPVTQSTEDKALVAAANASLVSVTTALQIMDDWDESDRAKVNPIVGQAGVAAGAGAVGATVQRATLASDDPAVVALQIMDDWDESNRAAVNLIAGQVGVAAGSGTTSALTQRVVESTDSPLITAINAGRDYETVAASQTTQTLGATGAAGDYLDGLLCVVATAATAQVQIKDGANSAITVLPNSPGAGVGAYPIPLGLVSTNGAWQITTGAGVSVIAIGEFT